MAIIDMCRIIGIINNQVLPKSPLPNSSLASGNTHDRTPFDHGQCLGERLFNDSPAVIIIAFR
ncbi:MAG: hypothetical protein PHO08_05195 [Methylococcales bacterium]|nr:hypothetical protein [Methylococcales bacterium]MDD5632209.1 hypothetical protein [Methylococcales bacterium]